MPTDPKHILTDITDRKQVEEALKESEERYRIAVEGSIDGVVIVQNDLYAYVNKAFLDIFGYRSSDEIVGKSRYCTIHPDDHERVAAYSSARLKSNNAPARYEFKGIKKDGTAINIEVSANIISYKGEKAILAYLRDITERKRAGEALKQSEATLRSVISASPVCIALDAPGRAIVWGNQAMADISGYTTDELSGQSARILYETDEEFSRVREMVYSSTQHGSGKGIETRWRRKDGEIRDVQLNVGWLNPGDISSGYVFIATDITEHRRAEEALHESEERYRMAIEQSNDGVSLLKGGQHLYVNQKFLEIFGYDEPEEVLGKGVPLTVHPDDLEMVMEYNRKRQTGEEAPSRYEFKGIRKDGAMVHIEVSAAKTTFRGDPVILVYFRDVTDRKRSEEALGTSQLQLLEAMDLAHIVYWEFDPVAQTFVFNDLFYAFYGTTAEQEGGYLVSREDYAKRFIHPDDIPLYYQFVKENTLRPDTELFADIEHRIIRRNGEVRHILARARVIRDDSGRIVKRYGANQDITERKLVEEKIRQMAYHDSMTGLPNRKLFSDRLGIALAQAQRNQTKIGIAMLDLDNFKGVNDTLGHGVGDLLLKATAERLSAALRKSDTVARLGGDEFVLILPDLEVMEDAIQVAQKIVDSFCKPLLIDTHQLVVTTSIGIAVYPDDGIDESTLLKNADIAMYQAKQAGRARYQLYKKACEDASEFHFPIQGFST